MSRADVVKIKLKFHEALFFVGLVAMLLLVIWLLNNYGAVSAGWLTSAAVLISVAGGVSVWNYRKFRRLLDQLEKC